MRKMLSAPKWAAVLGLGSFFSFATLFSCELNGLLSLIDRLLNVGLPEFDFVDVVCLSYYGIFQLGFLAF